MRWLAIIVSVLCLFSALAGRAAETKVFPLSDGSIVRFRGMTFGTNHPSPVKDGAWKWVPDNVAGLLGHTNLTRVTRPVSLVFWWTHEGTNITRDAFECSLVGSNGFESLLVGALPSSSSSNRMVYARFANFPLREKTLRTRVYEKSGGKLKALGEFTLDNPAFGLAKPWKAEPPGTIKRDREFEAALLSVETGVPVTSGAPRGASPVQSPGTTFHFELGKSAATWRLRAVYVTNSAGDGVNQHGLSTIPGVRNFGTSYARTPALWPNEPYLITARFAQDYNSIFAEEDRWAVTLAVPPSGKFSESDASTERHGLKLRVRGIRRAGSSPPWPSADIKELGNAFGDALGDALDVECAPLDGVLITVGMVMDDSNSDTSTRLTTTARNFSLPLRLKPGTSSITVLFYIHRVRTLQWIAEPRWRERK